MASGQERKTESLATEHGYETCPQTGLKKQIFQIPQLLSRIRIDRFLSQRIGMARHKIQQAIAEGRITVNGTIPKSSYRLLPGDQVQVIFPHPPAPEMQPEPIPLDIIYEDTWLIVINKPAGMVVHPTFKNWTGTLANALLYHLGTKPGIVHRLDKYTSGAIVVAKDDLSHRELARQFKDREIKKEYLAVVWGIPEPSEGTIQTNIGVSKTNRTLRAVYPFRGSEGKPAITDYRLLPESVSEAFSLVHIRLHTGRIHQIRVHMQHMGNPIVGDQKYGEVRDTKYEVRNMDQENLSPVLPPSYLARGGQLLHAWRLGLNHPHTGEEIHFEARLPEDMHPHCPS